ncbi:MAG: acyl-CoA dehydrogenase family protein [Pseudomonadota bacterium]
MDFNFSSEQEKIRLEVREFARTELAPHSAEWDREDRFPWEAVKLMGERGYMGTLFPKRLGGHERSHVELGITVEELARGDSTCAFIVAAQNGWGQEPVKWGDDFLRDVIKGNKVFAIGSTEPGMGSDSTAPRTTATLEGDTYVIRGVKAYISFAPVATMMGCTCRTLPDSVGMTGISYLKVPMDAPGVKVTTMPEMGMKAHTLGRIELANVRIPRSELLLPEHKGMYQVFAKWNLMRLLNTINPLGAALQSLEETMEYVKSRKAFGRPIAQNEAVQFKIVDDYISIEAGRMLVYRALSLMDENKPAAKEAAMAKAFGTVAAFRAVDNCLQNGGAFAYTSLSPIEQRFRDIRSWQLANGSVEMMKAIVGAELLGREYQAYKV